MTKIPPGLVQDPDLLLPEEIREGEREDESREERPEVEEPDLPSDEG